MAINAGSVYSDLVLNTQMYEQSLKGAEKQAYNFEESFKKIGKVISGVIAAAGIGKAIKASIEEGADLEQSIGGIETLFKQSADKVKGYADEAYRTAGLSANNYMESVTSFSASLLQSMGGDTETAADKANMALIDMSDNANKMGSSMESIQNAYQGFAKQNYTMLDNLKLGYGGTKTEMERLLTDAEKLTGVKYDISNLADVYDAIHAIQEELGITGTTAEEAAETFSGSLASMKAAFSNLLGNLSLGEDVGPSLDALSETVSTFLFGNFLPMIGNILKGIPQIVGAVFKDAIPYFLESGTELVNKLSTGITTGLPGLLTTLETMATNTMATITENLPQFLEKGVEVIKNIANGITNAIPQLIERALEIVSWIVDTIKNNLGYVLEAGINILKSLVQGIMDSLPTLIKEVPRIINQFANTIYEQLPTILKAGVEIIGILIKGLIQAIPTLIANIPQIIMAIVNVITLYNWANLGKSIITKLGEGISSMKGNIGNIAKSIADWVGTTINNVFKGGLNWGKGLITNMGQGFSSMLNYITTSASGLATSVINAIKSIFAGGFDIGKNLIQGLWNGILSLKETLLNNVGNFAGNILGAFKEKFGIASPSKVMEQYGKWIDEGLAIGIETNASKPISKTVNLANAIGSALDKVSNYVTNTVSIIEKEFDLWAIKNDVVKESSEYLEQQMEMQKQKHEILNQQIDATTHALNNAINVYGEGSIEALNYKNALLGLQIEQENLKNSIDKANDSLREQASLYSGKVSGDLSHAAKTARKNRGTYDDYYSGPTKSIQYDAKGNISRIVDGDKIKKYALGTDYHLGGLAWVGEQGPELIDLPRGSKVYTNEESKEIAKGSNGGITQYIEIHSPIPLSPSETARKYKQASQQLAMEWGF